MSIKKNGTPQVPGAIPTPTEPPPSVPAEVTTKVDLGPYDSLKDRRISRAGLYQAALQSQGVMVHNSQSFDQFLAGVRKAADEGMKYINE